MANELPSESIKPDLVSWEQYLRDSAAPRETIDHFLKQPTWSQFDPELGYGLHNSLVPWGINGSRTIETFQSNGARSGFAYASRKPRINSYGNSFTEGNQVSDGETWQEYLAGHFGEPIGNYGIGGHGVYQACRRMLRNEKTEHGAEYIILYVWGDDPARSLLASCARAGPPHLIGSSVCPMAIPGSVYFMATRGRTSRWTRHLGRSSRKKAH